MVISHSNLAHLLPKSPLMLRKLLLVHMQTSVVGISTFKEASNNDESLEIEIEAKRI